MFLSVTLFLNNSVCEAAHSAQNIQERTDIIYLLNMPHINIEYIYKHILFIHLIWPILHDEHAERLYVLTNVCMHIDECHKLCTFTSTCTCIHTRLCVHVRVCLHLVRAHTVYAYTPRTRLSDARRFRIQGLGLFFFKVPLN